jgi:tRNA threonylcarbamoyladenosine biosynthesis protein TsaE
MEISASHYIGNEQAMLDFGKRLGRFLCPGSITFLVGDLGAGKTTLARGILQGLNYSGAVKSPTYTLVEPYSVRGGTLYHFDLYRLQDPEELEYLGIRDYFAHNTLALIEWPEKGEGVLPEPDLVISISYKNSGRQLAVEATSKTGNGVLREFETS